MLFCGEGSVVRVMVGVRVVVRVRVRVVLRVREPPAAYCTYDAAKVADVTAKVAAVLWLGRAIEREGCDEGGVPWLGRGWLCGEEGMWRGRGPVERECCGKGGAYGAGCGEGWVMWRGRCYASVNLRRETEFCGGPLAVKSILFYFCGEGGRVW